MPLKVIPCHRQPLPVGELLFFPGQASHHDDDAERSLRPVGGQDDVEATSSDRVEVSCVDDISSIILEDTNSLVARYRHEVLMPSEQCRAHLPLKGYVTVSESFLKFGV